MDWLQSSSTRKMKNNGRWKSLVIQIGPGTRRVEVRRHEGAFCRWIHAYSRTQKLEDAETYHARSTGPEYVALVSGRVTSESSSFASDKTESAIGVRLAIYGDNSSSICRGPETKGWEDQALVREVVLVPTKARQRFVSSTHCCNDESRCFGDQDPSRKTC